MHQPLNVIPATAHAIAGAPVAPRAGVRAAALGAILIGTVGAAAGMLVVVTGTAVVAVFARVENAAMIVLIGAVSLAAPVLFTLLILSGIRLLTNWAVLRRSADWQEAENLALREVTRDLLRTRLLAGLLMLLSVLPFAVPSDGRGWGSDTFRLGLWRDADTARSMAAVLLAWIVGCGVVLIAARRAVWDLAIALGASHTPGVGVAFEVLVPGLAAPARPAPLAVTPAPLAVTPAPLPVTPVTPAEPVATSAVPVAAAVAATPVVAAPVAAAPVPVLPAVLLSSGPAAPPPDSASAAAANAAGLRTWESLLFGAQLLLLGACVLRLPTLIPEYVKYRRWKNWTAAFDDYSIGLSGVGTGLAPAVDDVRGYAGVAFTASHLMLGLAVAVAVAWAGWSLTVGPRFRRGAVVVLRLVLVMMVARVALALFLSGGSLDLEMFDPVGGTYGRYYSRQTTLVWIPAMLLREGVLPAALLLLLQREPVKALFAFRPKRPARSA